MKYTLRADLPLEEQERLREKDREYSKTRRNKPEYKEYIRKRWREERPKLYRNNRKSVLKRKYGITWADYEKLFENQKGLCALCSREPEEERMLAVDHCHKTNRVRGLLCGSCNRALGLFKDDPNLLFKAGEYVS